MAHNILRPEAILSQGGNYLAGDFFKEEIASLSYVKRGVNKAGVSEIFKADFETRMSEARQSLDFVQ